MEEYHDKAGHVLCVVSPAYLKAPYSALERRAAQWAAVTHRPNFVLPVFIAPSVAPTLFGPIKRCDLHGIDEDEAKARFTEYMRPAARPTGPVAFPGEASGLEDPISALSPGSVSFPGKADTVSNIPIRVPFHFLGRDDDLAAIDRAIKSNNGRAAITALHGLRGVGKSTLAAAYAGQHQGDYRATWWIRAETEPTMRADLVGLGVQLGWVASDAPEQAALEAVLERLRHNGEGILLIYDNAISSGDLDKFLPRGGGPRIIVTSNAPNWRRVAAPVEIEVRPNERLR